jgi:hypothetical protein
MKRIVLPGHGTATTFTPTRDSVVTVLTNGQRIPIALKANQPTRVEFLGSLAVAA